MISQNDPRWKDLPINGTAYKMGGYGCFVACLSYVAGIEPPEALKKLRFDGALVTWDSITQIGLEPLEKVNTYDNNKVKQYIAENGQCIVRVDWDGSSRTDDTHFVVYIGNGRLLDPWDGKEKPTSAYPLVTGIRACRRIMNADEIAVKKTVFEELVKKSTERDDLFSTLGVDSLEGAKNVIGGYKSRITDLGNQLGTAQAEMKNREEQVARLKDQIANLTSEVNNLTESLKVKIGEYEDLAVAKGKQYIELQQALTTIDTLKQAQTNGEITLTLADLFKLIWHQKITIKKG